MKRRLSRAKAKIKVTAIPFAVPTDRLLPDRLAAVLAVVCLIFNQGYTDRDDLAAEATRLGRLLAELMTDEPEVRALLALMLRTTHAARRVLSTDSWYHWRSRIAPATTRRRSRRAVLPSCEHWPCGRRPGRICSRRRSPRSRRRRRSTGTRSRCSTSGWSGRPAHRWWLCTAQWRSPRRALELVDSLELDGYRYLHSTRAELLRRLGRQEEARAAFEHALRLAATDRERRFLARRLAGL